MLSIKKVWYIIPTQTKKTGFLQSEKAFSDGAPDFHKTDSVFPKSQNKI